jgi:hypothetical protein
MLAELRAPEGGGIEGLALEALLEVRAKLRAIAAVRDPLIVTMRVRKPGRSSRRSEPTNELSRVTI